METFNHLPGALQVALLCLAGIPVTIFFSALFLLAKMRLTALIHQAQIRRLVRKYAPFGLDPLRIPVRLHQAIPLAARWAAMNASQRQEAVKGLSPDDKIELTRLLRGKEQLIRDWNRLPVSAGAKEARAFAILLSIVEDLGLIVLPESNEEQLAPVEAAIPAPYPGQRIYYVPQPKTWLEKTVEGLMDTSIYLVLCPIYFWMLVKIWVILLPGVESGAGIALVSIGAALLSLSTVRLVRNLLARGKRS